MGLEQNGVRLEDGTDVEFTNIEVVLGWWMLAVWVERSEVCRRGSVKVHTEKDERTFVSSEPVRLSHIA